MLTEIQRCTLTHPHHSRRYQMRGTVVMPQAAGHPALQMNTLLCTAPASFSCVAACGVCILITVTANIAFIDDCCLNRSVYHLGTDQIVSPSLCGMLYFTDLFCECPYTWFGKCATCLHGCSNQKCYITVWPVDCYENLSGTISRQSKYQVNEMYS